MFKNKFVNNDSNDTLNDWLVKNYIALNCELKKE